MRSETPFRVHVGEHLRRPGIARSHHLVVPVDWSVDMSHVVPDPPLDAELQLVATSGGVVVKGDVDVTARHICARCTTEFQQPMSIDILQVVERATPPGEEGGDYRLEGEEIDLEPILRDEVLLSMPLLAHCSSCTELVRPPESDLNTSAPGETRRPESPFAVLQDLFESGD